MSGYLQDAVFDPEPDWIRSGAVLAPGGISATWASINLQERMGHVPHPTWLREGQPRWSEIQREPTAYFAASHQRFLWPEAAWELWSQSFEDFAEHPEERAFFAEFENHEMAWRGIPNPDFPGDFDEQRGFDIAQTPQWFRDEWVNRDTTMRHSKMMNLLARTYARWFVENIYLERATLRRGTLNESFGGTVAIENYSAQYFLSAMGVDTLGGAYQPSRVIARHHVTTRMWEGMGGIPVDGANAVETTDSRWAYFHYPLIRNHQDLFYRLLANQPGNFALRGNTGEPASVTAARLIELVVRDGQLPTFGSWPTQTFHNPPSHPFVTGSTHGMLRRDREAWWDVSTHYGVGFFPGGTVLIEEDQHFGWGRPSERVIREVEIPPLYVLLLGAFYHNPDDNFWNEEVWDTLTRDVHPHRMLASFEHHRRFPWPKAEVVEGTRERGSLQSEWFGRLETFGLHTEWARHESLGKLWTRSFEWGPDAEHDFYRQFARVGSDFHMDLFHPGQKVWPTQPGTGFMAQWGYAAGWVWQPIEPGDPDYGQGRGPNRNFRFFWSDNWERDHHHARLNTEEWAQPYGINDFGGPMQFLHPERGTFPVTIFLESLNSRGLVGYSTLLGQWFITREGLWPWVYSIDTENFIYVIGGNGDNILWTYDYGGGGWTFNGRYGNEIWSYSFTRQEWTHLGQSQLPW